MGLQNSVPCWVVGRMTDKLPFGGEVVRLGELVESSKAKNKDGLFADVYSVTNSHGFVPSQEYFNKEVYSKELRTYRVVHRNMIAYNPSRINIGSVAVQDKVDNAIVSPLYVVFSADETKVIPGYLVRFLRSKPGLDQIAQQSIGTVRSNLKFDALCKMQMPLPSLQTQVERMNKLTLVEQLADGCENYLFHLDELVKSRFVEMFGDSIENPKGWVKKPIGEVYEVGSAKRVYARDQVSEGIPFLRLGDLTNRIQQGVESCDLYIAEELYEEYKAKGLVPDAGDILVTARGTMGLCYEVKPEDRFYFQDGMITWLHAKTESPLPVFLTSLFANGHFDEDLHEHTSGTTVKYLSIKTLSQLRLILPPLALQQEFAAFVRQVDKLRFEQLVALKKRGSQHLIAP